MDIEKHVFKVKRENINMYICDDFKNKLCQIAESSLKIENAGGSSKISEAYSINTFYHMGCAKFIFEKQIQYHFVYKMVDYICEHHGVRFWCECYKMFRISKI